MLSLMFLICMSMVRYPVGESVPPEVYTAPFAPDGIYRFMQTSFLSDPNDPNSVKKVQAAPNDWITTFGNNERTLIFHTLSELRFIQAQQAQRLLELEKKDPNDGH